VGSQDWGVQSRIAGVVSLHGMIDSLGTSKYNVVGPVRLPARHGSVEEVPGLLYSIAQYDAQQGGVLGPGNTSTDLQQVDWEAFGRSDTGTVSSPPRTVLQWRPMR
jgi:hypothetical protein